MAHLTDRQDFVLQLKSEGKTNREIACILHVSEQSIQECATAAVKKLGADNVLNGVALYAKTKAGEEYEDRINKLSEIERIVSEMNIENIAIGVAQEEIDYAEAMTAIIRAIKK